MGYIGFAQVATSPRLAGYKAAGVGKETFDRWCEIPGWTTAVKPLLQIDNHSINVLADPNIAALITLVMAALAKEPAAKKKVIDALNKRQPANFRPPRFNKLRPF